MKKYSFVGCIVLTRVYLVAKIHVHMCQMQHPHVAQFPACVKPLTNNSVVEWRCFDQI